MENLASALGGGMRQQTGRKTLLLVEDSRAFSALLSYRFREELGLDVVQCASVKAVRDAVAEIGRTFAIAVVDLNLPDSPHGEVLDITIEHAIPTIVFTGTFDLAVRERVLERKVADYVVKDSDTAVDTLVSSVGRLMGNRETTVLVVDDMSSARQSLVDLLVAQLFKVVEASTGREALEALERHPGIELVITDYHMPDMDGYELTRRIRRQYSSERLRIIGVSSSSDRMLSVSFLKAGASDFVYRPFVAEELQCRVGHHIETLSQIKRLRAAAACDYLTGLFNRRYFYDIGPKQIDKCLNRTEACSAAILDIDHFKRLNDTFGHEIGDRVLRAVAARLQELVEDSGHLLARLGGEEFGLLLVGLDGAAATEYCDHLRQQIASIQVPAKATSLAVTISIGVAEVVGRETFDNYLNAADQFLYMAKHAGRNQVYSDHRMTLTAAGAR